MNITATDIYLTAAMTIGAVYWSRWFMFALIACAVISAALSTEGE